MPSTSSNAVLYYIYEGPRTGKRGRPKTKDGKIDFANPDKCRMTRLDIDPEEGEALNLWHGASLEAESTAGNPLSARRWTPTVFRPIPLSLRQRCLDIYRTRFQIEFCFRDGHQFTGLPDCQARDEKALDFAFTTLRVCRRQHHQGAQEADEYALSIGSNYPDGQRSFHKKIF